MLVAGGRHGMLWRSGTRLALGVCAQLSPHGLCVWGGTMEGAQAEVWAALPCGRAPIGYVPQAALVVLYVYNVCCITIMY